MEKKILPTGVVIHYDRNGNMKYVESPYYEKKKDNPVRGSILRYLSYQLKQLIK